MTDRTYREQTDPITSDKRDRIIPASSLRKKVLALDVARNAEHLVLHGDFLFADRNSTGQVDVQLNSTSEDAWPLTAQDGVRDIPIRDVFITHAAQAGKVLNLWYGYRARFLAGANSIASIGSILSPVDLNYRTLAGDDETINGKAFIGGWDQTPGAGVISYVQLLNPAASGKLVYVERILAFAGASAVLHLRNYATALVLNTGQAANKSWGGAAPVAQVRANNEAAQRGTLVSEFAFILTGDQGVEVLKKGPIELAAGEGLIVGPAVANIRPNVHFEWREY